MSTREAIVKGLIRRRYAHHASMPGREWGGEVRALHAGYTSDQLSALPANVVETWAGCGNVIAGAYLHQADVIVDIGAGGGLDARLACGLAKSGTQVIAIDLTPEMLALESDRQTGLMRIAGDMEQLPLGNAICDLVIANAAFNLALDPARAFAEVWRILVPGGRLHICELVRDGELPAELLADPLGWSTSLGGVLEEAELVEVIRGAGFSDLHVSGHRPFEPVVAVRITARKPAASSH